MRQPWKYLNKLQTNLESAALRAGDDEDELSSEERIDIAINKPIKINSAINKEEDIEASQIKS